MMKVLYRLIYSFCFIYLLASCHSTKYVAQGEYLLDKVVIDTDNKDYKASEMKNYLRQQPNFKAFGLVKWQLYFYGWSGRKNNWVNNQIRRMGEAPVILDTTLVDQSVIQFERFLTNKGYTDAVVTASIDTTRNKKAVVTYTIESNQPYRISSYDIDLYDPRMDSIAHLSGPSRGRHIFSPLRSTSGEDYYTLVREGNLFDRDLLDRERQRVTNLLRRRGYYAFNRDYIGYLADSTHNDHTVGLEMILRPYREVRSDGQTIEQPHRQYYVKDVTIMTDYDPLRFDSEIFTRTDSVHAGNIDILYGKSGRNLRPGVLRRANYIQPGELFNERTLEQTYASFSSLAAVRNVNIHFDEIQENDTMKLHAYIRTTPAKTHGFGADIEGTNSAGNFGFAASTNYRHRNLFKGSEVLTVKVRGAYEALTGKKNYIATGSYWEIGGETSLNVPRFVFPFLTEDFRRRLRATTEFRASYNRQRRPEYERAIVSGGWRYNWNSRVNTLARHTFKLLEVDYLYLPHIDSVFYSNLPPVTQIYNYNNLFIMGAGYSYSYNDFNPQNRQRNTTSFRISVDLAGNLLYAFSNTFKTSKDDQGRYTLFGNPYSQFAKLDADYSKGIVLDGRNRIAYRLGFDIAVPYGNADRVPFERRYFSGGANSVRGWSVRSLGPGRMALTDSTSFAIQAGDIRFDANIEYRTRLFWKFELAGFIDAGNIWTIRNYKEEQPGGQFKFSRFYKEIAFSYGLGLRLDFDFFLIRLDGGWKAYDPQQRGSRKWAIRHPNFNDNFALHFAVGYPF